MAGCSVDPTEGGGGFEGEALTLRGTATHAGRALTGASVAFLDRRTQANLGHATTDAGGNFSMRLPKGSKGFLEIRSGDTALSRTLWENIPSASISVDAATPVVWKARLTNSVTPLAGSRLRILGATDSVTTAADGSFALLRPAAPAEWVSIRSTDGTLRDILLPPTTDSLIVLPDHDSIVFDDFEASGNRSRLGASVGSGWWFVNDDAASQGTSTALPQGVTSDFTLAYSSTDAFKGNSVSLQFSIDNSHQIHYCQLGIVLADSGSYMDLSKVDSISFQAKGSGNFRLLFGTRTSMEPTLDPVGMTGANLTLPSTWTRMVVRRSDIASEIGSRSAVQGIPWLEESKYARTMVFFFNASGTLQLDDVVFHGAKRSDLQQTP